jgi:hypothetical protein
METHCVSRTALIKLENLKHEMRSSSSSSSIYYARENGPHRACGYAKLFTYSPLFAYSTQKKALLFFLFLLF